jgi:hypothetical protein
VSEKIRLYVKNKISLFIISWISFVIIIDVLSCIYRNEITYAMAVALIVYAMPIALYQIAKGVKKQVVYVNFLFLTSLQIIWLFVLDMTSHVP